MDHYILWITLKISKVFLNFHSIWDVLFKNKFNCSNHLNPNKKLKLSKTPQKKNRSKSKSMPIKGDDLIEMLILVDPLIFSNVQINTSVKILILFRIRINKSSSLLLAKAKRKIHFVIWVDLCRPCPFHEKCPRKIRYVCSPYDISYSNYDSV